MLRKIEIGSIILHVFLSSVAFIIIFYPAFALSENLLRAPKLSVHIVPEEQIQDNKNSLSIKVFSAPVVFYQKFLSPYWGYKCAHYPSCSRYSRMAFKKHGAIIGFIMTFDRLQHEANEARFSPLIEMDGETKVYDAIENNDFWWFKR